jgi:D-arginine dehydrogenase
MAAFDFIIIGSGIAGASIAYHLAGEGRVLVLERESQPGYHTTGRSAATFSAGYAVGPLSLLTRASEAFLTAPPEDFSDHPILTARGSLSIAALAKADALDQAFAEQSRANPRLQRLDAKAISEMVPILRPEHAALGIFDPDMKDLDVHALHQGYLKHTRRGGVTIATDSEVRALRRDGQVWRVQVGADAHEAPILINAAGAWADEIARLAGLRQIGLEPKRRTVITFDVPASVDLGPLPCVVEMDHDWYLKPDAGRILASPADETPSPPCDAQPEEYDIAVIMAHMNLVLTFPVARPQARWAGLRSFVSDRGLVIGWAGDAEGFFWQAGQGGHGIQSAEAAARLAVSMILGNALPSDLKDAGIDMAELSPDRPALRQDGD